MSSYSHTARRAAGMIGQCLLLSGLAASAAMAQKKKKECAPVQDNGSDYSTELYSGQLFLQKVTDPKIAEGEKNDDLKNGINALWPHNKVHDPVGQAYLLGDALTLFVNRHPDTTTAPRSYFGFKEHPDNVIDVLKLSDSLLTVVTKKHPECDDWAFSARQQAFTPIVNIAIRQMNDQHGDSAVAAANRANEIYSSSPYTYNVVAGVAVKNNDYVTALANYQKVIALSDTNSRYTSLKRGAEYNVAVITMQQAENDSATDKKAKIAAAVDMWKAYTAAYPDDDNGKDGLAHALQVSGDTLSSQQITADLLVHPEKYPFSSIYNAAVRAYGDKNWSDALKYFQATLSHNPYMRNALFYLSATYLSTGDTTKIPPYMMRAIALDPNDPESYQIMAITYQSRSKAEKNPAVRKVLTDSLLYFFNKYHDMQAHVTVSTFERAPAKLTFGGKVHNLTTADKTYTVNFQFLDSTGTVVARQSTPALAVPAKDSASFAMTIENGGIFGYQYAPIDSVGIVVKK